jgi:hypothetical protein
VGASVAELRVSSGMGVDKDTWVGEAGVHAATMAARSRIKNLVSEFILTALYFASPIRVSISEK